MGFNAELKIISALVVCLKILYPVYQHKNCQGNLTTKMNKSVTKKINKNKIVEAAKLQLWKKEFYLTPINKGNVPREYAAGTPPTLMCCVTTISCHY